ncbi:tyrosine-type recombinase/integrase [Microvirga tunisiensis]|uniref:Tyrosine-type recombinase/integrase n=1 Tax=Microvirga tunisiensis TaxID=2108360 RepID=A0A5N7MR85_9HYPH|nr:tyrosine-type recombinase/integrase [Microvirga tunisiensis]MPR29521.1 tyrosine-type recombinase/integrase [Microvirga tunisiensis]
MGRPRKNGVDMEHVHPVKAKVKVNGKSVEKVYWYYQYKRSTPDAGPRYRLPDDPHSPEFWAAIRNHSGAAVYHAKTVKNLCLDYQTSPEWNKLKAASKKDYKRYIAIIVEKWGKFPASDIRPVHVLALRDTYADLPSTANHMLSVVRTVFKWGIPREYLTINPARDVSDLDHQAEGHKPWPAWAIKLIAENARREIRTAVALGLYTGQRMADVVSMSIGAVQGNTIQVAEDDQHQNAFGLKGDRAKITQSKTKKHLTIPLHQSLKPVIEECRRRGNIFLAPRPKGQPHTSEQFQAMWQREMKKEWATPLKEHGLSFHGLRATATCILKEIGCTDAQIQSITGMSKQMIERYTQHMDRDRLAVEAIQLWEESGR